MFKPHRLIALLAPMTLAVGSADAAVVFSDNFQSLDTDATDNTADGDGVSGTAGYDVTLSSGSSSFTAVTDDKLGNAGRLDDGSSNDQDFGFVAAAYSTVTLDDVGDSLTLSFDFSIDNIENNGSAFRFGLWDATSGIGDADGPNYWAKVSTDSTAGSATAVFEDDGTASDSYPGRNFGTLATSSSTGAIVTDDSVISAVFELERVATGLQVSASFFEDVTDPIDSVSFIDTTPVTSDFNAVGFRQGSVTMDVNLDNIIVDFDPIPEPASLALLAAGGLMVLPRRRRA
jgi:hypothetical protein